MTDCPSCHTPTDKHEAGRELDRCVAEARGWKFSENDHEPYNGFPANGPNSWQEIPIPHFSTSFAACEVLIEEMVGDPARIDALKVWGWDKNTWWVDDAEVYNAGRVEAPTLPHAICLAYLAYKGKEGGE